MPLEHQEIHSPSGSVKDNDRGTNQVNPFLRTLSQHGLVLERGETKTLQINVGFLCNQLCRHCHLSAGPGRKENMTLETAEEVVSYISRSRFDTVDITGGAPELMQRGRW